MHLLLLTMSNSKLPLFVDIMFPFWKDDEGQTPLHYAVMCEREAIAEYLVKHNADIHSKDNDESSPLDICKPNWPCMQQHVGEVN